MSNLFELAACYGIHTRYHQIDGTLCVASPDVLLATLQAMGCPVSRIEDAADALREYRETRKNARAHSSRAFSNPGKKWGLFLPLYALRSHKNWGAGDFSDLRHLAEWTGRHGGSVLGTLPLLPTNWESKKVPSPYAPWTRLFWNPFFVDCTVIPELERCPSAQKILASAEFQSEVAKCRETPRVDYHRLMALKERILYPMAQLFLATPSSERHTAFDHYVQCHSELHSYCDYLAKTQSRNAQYYPYIQWIADTQLADAAETGRSHGVQLYLDFPIGVHPDGYDAWRYKDCFVPKMRVGAPPDPFFDKGQDWGFQPLHPLRLHEGGYEYWTRCIQHHMQYAGVLRLDHVMGLHRQFWIPEGYTAKDGVYVSYPAEDFYAILCRESRRFETTLIGEDLGTVPPEVRTAMHSHGLFRMYILQFDPAFDATTAIPRHCLVALNTHDIPPFAAFWGHRPEVRASLQRALDCMRRSPAEICMINIEDLWLETTPQNRPGTVSLNNWTHKARYCMEDFDRLLQGLT